MKKNNNANTDVTLEALQAQIAELMAKNAALEARRVGNAPSISCKVGGKGGVSVYGLGRFPVTLYGSQWIRFLSAVPSIATFCRDNADRLTVKEGEDREAMAKAFGDLVDRFAEPKAE